MYMDTRFPLVFNSLWSTELTRVLSRILKIGVKLLSTGKSSEFNHTSLWDLKKLDSQ